MNPTTHHGLGQEVLKLLPRCSGRDLHLSLPKSSGHSTLQGEQEVRLEPHSAWLCPILWDQQRLTQTETPFRHRSASCRTSGNAQVSHPASDPARPCLASGCATILLLCQPLTCLSGRCPTTVHAASRAGCCLQLSTPGWCWSTEGGRKQGRKQRRKRPQLGLHKAVRLLC